METKEGEQEETRRARSKATGGLQERGRPSNPILYFLGGICRLLNCLKMKT